LRDGTDVEVDHDRTGVIYTFVRFTAANAPASSAFRRVPSWRACPLTRRPKPSATGVTRDEPQKAWDVREIPGQIDVSSSKIGSRREFIVSCGHVSHNL